MSIRRSQSATSSSCSCFTWTMPAQLTRIWSPPNSRTVWSIELRTGSSRRTSHSMNTARPLRQIQHPLARGAADVAEELIRPGDAVRREHDVLELPEALRLGQRLLVEAV